MRKTKEDTEISKLRILLAAEEEFCLHGFAAANLDNIAKAAGLTRGAIFWHYKSKANLFRAVVKRAINTLNEMNTQTFSRTGISVMENRKEMLKKLINGKSFDILLMMADCYITGEVPKNILNELFKETKRLFNDSYNSLSEAKRRGELHEDTNIKAVLLSLNVVLTGFAKMKQLKALTVPINEKIDDDVIIQILFDGLLSFQKNK